MATNNLNRIFVFAAAIVTMVGGFAGAAKADVEFCNRRAHGISLAIAFERLYPDGARQWQSFGWVNMDTDSCKRVLKGTARGKRLYIYVMVHEQDRTVAITGDRQLCMSGYKFQLVGKELVKCPNGPYVVGEFQSITPSRADSRFEIF